MLYLVKLLFVRLTIYFSLFFSLLFINCSTKKNNFLNRNYHLITTKYNVLFNGSEAFDIGLKILEDNNIENFYNILSAEPMMLDFENVDESSSIPSFSIAEEKATKAIQKHSMNIDGYQRNRQISKAYLLLGKARYYDRRFFQALETFNYLINQYSDKNVFNEARIWREKTNLRLENNDIVINNLKSIDEGFINNKKIISDLNATIAEAYLKLKKNDSAMVYFKKALENKVKGKKTNRYKFILAQLYEKENAIDSAKKYFKSLIKEKKRTSPELLLHAKLNFFKLSYLDTNEKERVLNNLEGLINNFENRNLRHYIYHYKAIILMNDNLDSLGINSLIKSSGFKSIDIYTKKRNYRILSNYYFKKNNFIETSKYLDSLSKITKIKNQKDKILREKKIIQKVVNFEKMVKKNDSLIGLAKMDRSEIENFYITNVFYKKNKQKIDESNSDEFKSTDFYFYNSKLISYGKNIFISNWGEKSNLDNWKYSQKIDNSNFNFSNEKDKNENEYDNKINLDQFISQIRVGKKFIDSLQNDTNENNLKLSDIYYNDFNNHKLSKNKLRKVLVNSPNNDQKVNAYFKLYIIFKKQNNDESDNYKDKIINEFPNSVFAQKIKNTIAEGDLNDAPFNLYKKYLDLFNNKEYEKLLEDILNTEEFLKTTEYGPKLGLIRTISLGRVYGLKEFKKKLNNLAKKYPNSEEAEYAKNSLILFNQDNTNLYKKKIFKNYKWIFIFDKNQINEMDLVKNKLILFKEKNRIKNWKISEDFYNFETRFLVIHIYGDKPDKEYILDELEKEFNFKIISKNFVLLKSDYLNLQLNKNLTN